MSDSRERLERFINTILRQHRPKRFTADEDEAALLRVAIEMHAARPGADLPSEEFVGDLSRELTKAAQANGSWVSRRTLLRAGGVAAAAAVVGAGADRLLGMGSSPPSPAQAEMVPSNGVWTEVAKVADLPAGSARRFSTASVQGILVNDGAAISALSAVCTHQGCILAVDNSRRQFVCPCHNATFRFNGTSSGEYKNPPLPKLKTRTNGDAIEVLVV